MALKEMLRDHFPGIRLKNIIIILSGSAIVAFGLYNIHDPADITEGGILGLELLLEYWLGISPAFTSLVLTALCFYFGWRTLGRSFIIYSAFSVGSFSLFYLIAEQTPRAFPHIAEHPLTAAIAGAVFIGVGAGLTVKMGGAQSGDDALAMAINHRWGCKVSTVYLISDVTVLLLSLSYIPLNRIVYSLITVILSGQIIELILMLGKKERADADR